ncbi:hybrid sensor histidine kinase/response regulator [Thiorhodovibrio frisius]|uniref:hybrid sensor histidine kinase/response regulator n=1 Tax=Thiorhodovibrio frisius TaxID=631362 RepID=UPI00167FA5D2|nr:HAMP domain-containing sensor histidine kinase [Thiorhodovibrio frisius]
MTGLHEEEFEIRGLELGAADYIHRPFNAALVRLRIATHLQASRASVALRERNIALEYQAQAVHQRADALEQGARQREDIDRVLRHDLKGPLSPIIGFADLMLEDDNLTADQIENLHIIRDAGHRILGMIQRSLDLYKMETHRYRYKPRNENIDRIVGSVMSSMKPLADTSGVALRYSNSDSDSNSTIMFPVEEMLLHLLLSNLTKNAIEASSKGQAVDIEHQLETSKPKAEKLILSVSNPSLVPEGIRTHFFDKYVTTGKSNGTGLGTYAARLMATTMGGKLIMRSAPQVGTRVTLTLPKPKPLSMLYTTG